MAVDLLQLTRLENDLIWLDAAEADRFLAIYVAGVKGPVAQEELLGQYDDAPLQRPDYDVHRSLWPDMCSLIIRAASSGSSAPQYSLWPALSPPHEDLRARFDEIILARRNAPRWTSIPDHILLALWLLEQAGGSSTIASITMTMRLVCCLGGFWRGPLTEFRATHEVMQFITRTGDLLHAKEGIRRPTDEEGQATRRLTELRSVLRGKLSSASPLYSILIDCISAKGPKGTATSLELVRYTAQFFPHDQRPDVLRYVASAPFYFSLEEDGSYSLGYAAKEALVAQCRATTTRLRSTPIFAQPTLVEGTDSQLISDVASGEAGPKQRKRTLLSTASPPPPGSLTRCHSLLNYVAEPAKAQATVSDPKAQSSYLEDQDGGACQEIDVGEEDNDDVEEVTFLLGSQMASAERHRWANHELGVLIRACIADTAANGASLREIIAAVRPYYFGLMSGKGQLFASSAGMVGNIETYLVRLGGKQLAGAGWTLPEDLEPLAKVRVKELRATALSRLNTYKTESAVHYNWELGLLLRHVFALHGGAATRDEITAYIQPLFPFIHSAKGRPFNSTHCWNNLSNYLSTMMASRDASGKYALSNNVPPPTEGEMQALMKVLEARATVATKAKEQDSDGVEEEEESGNDTAHPAAGMEVRVKWNRRSVENDVAVLLRDCFARRGGKVPRQELEQLLATYFLGLRSSKGNCYKMRAKSQRWSVAKSYLSFLHAKVDDLQHWHFKELTPPTVEEAQRVRQRAADAIAALSPPRRMTMLSSGESSRYCETGVLIRALFSEGEGKYSLATLLEQLRSYWYKLRTAEGYAMRLSYPTVTVLRQYLVMLGASLDTSSHLWSLVDPNPPSTAVVASLRANVLQRERAITFEMDELSEDLGGDKQTDASEKEHVAPSHKEICKLKLPKEKDSGGSTQSLTKQPPSIPPSKRSTEQLSDDSVAKRSKSASAASTAVPAPVGVIKAADLEALPPHRFMRCAATERALSVITAAAASRLGLATSHVELSVVTGSALLLLDEEYPLHELVSKETRIAVHVRQL